MQEIKETIDTVNDLLKRAIEVADSQGDTELGDKLDSIKEDVEDLQDFYNKTERAAKQKIAAS